jgi:hypothetical protein
MERTQPKENVRTETPQPERSEKRETPRLKIETLETRVAPFAIWGD